MAPANSKRAISLIQYTGTDPTESSTEDQLTPFIDTEYFVFKYGQASDGDRVLDSQWTTSSVYNSTVMNSQKCFFGVNFADGRIKCYPLTGKNYFVLYVRDNETYGQNSFQDKGYGTIFYAETGLTWQQADNGQGTTWVEALDYCEDLMLAGHND